MPGQRVLQQQLYDFKMDEKLNVMREYLDGLWMHALKAIKSSDIGYLTYILNTAITPLVSDLEAIEGEESVNLAKDVLGFIQYVEIAVDSMNLKVKMKKTRAACYEQETDEFQREVDMFIDGLDSD